MADIIVYIFTQRFTNRRIVYIVYVYTTYVYLHIYIYTKCTFREQEALLNSTLITELCLGRWIWKSLKTKAGGAVPWNIQEYIYIYICEVKHGSS